MIIDPIPPKLLDCPEFAIRSWARDGFHRLGHGLRLDYTTRIHSDDGDWQPYMHRFTSDVSLYVPGEMLIATAREGTIHDLPEPHDPIVFGVADRIDFLDHDAHRIMIRGGVHLGSDEEEHLAWILGESYVAWDVENHQIVVLDDRGRPSFVICDGSLDLTKDEMIVG